LYPFHRYAALRSICTLRIPLLPPNFAIVAFFKSFRRAMRHPFAALKSITRLNAKFLFAHIFFLVAKLFALIFLPPFVVLEIWFKTPMLRIAVLLIYKPPVTVRIFSEISPSFPI